MSLPNHLTQLSRVALLYLMAVLLASAVIMYNILPVWITGAAIVCIGWRLLIFTGKFSFPPLWIKTVLVFLSMAGVLFQFRYSLSVDVFVSILMLGFSLKLLEVYHKPSAQQLLYLAVFVLMTYLLYEQTLTAGVVTFFHMLLITAALIAVNTGVEVIEAHFLQPIKRASLVLLIAAPLMAVIFLVMPRLNPLWHMPLQAKQAKTGMSEQMSPGDITRLTNSPDLVFRSSFSGSIPPKKELYWQGFMFDEFDGRQWKNNCDCNYTWVNSNRVPLPTSQAPLISYQIMMEPHGNRWIFALPDTIMQDDRIRTNNDNLFRTRREIVDKIAYEGKVFTQTNIQPLKTAELKRYLKLPKQGNPQTHKLAQAWRTQTADDSKIIQQALDLYRGDMNYSLTPPPLGINSIDDFLFVTKTGFCEHFASSFVFLMRAAGIPARVILGYQGGEINQLEGYVTVRQYDAHAWAQVWLPNQGWVKVDPTMAVNSARINLGFDSAFANSPVLNSPLDLKAYRNINLLNVLRLKLDYMDYAWSRWVVGYNAGMQNTLLHQLGLTSPLRMVIWLVGLLTTFFVAFILMLWIVNRRQQHEHPLSNRYRKLMMAYAHLGLERSLSDTPLQFAQRVAQNKLPFCDEFLVISAKYHQWFCSDQMQSFAMRELRWKCLYWQMRLGLK